MSYYGQYPFNTNGGALLSKRNYINRKLDEIEQKLIQLGWYNPNMVDTSMEVDEYELPIESAGALIPYRDKVNKRLDLYEEIIKRNTTDFENNGQNTMYQNPEPIMYQNPAQEVKKSFDSKVVDLFA